MPFYFNKCFLGKALEGVQWRGQIPKHAQTQRTINTLWAHRGSTPAFWLAAGQSLEEGAGIDWRTRDRGRKFTGKQQCFLLWRCWPHLCLEHKAGGKGHRALNVPDPALTSDALALLSSKSIIRRAGALRWFSVAAGGLLLFCSIGSRARRRSSGGAWA